MSTIENNEEEQEEQDRSIDSASDRMVGDHERENAQVAGEKAKEGIKKIAQNKKVIAFVAAHIVPILIILGIILLIIILVGQFAFFTTMPGMMLEKIKKFALSVWGEFTGFFTGDTISTSVSKEDVVSLAQYLQNMGYDINSCGLGIAQYEDVTDENKDKTRQLKSIGPTADGREYLKTYLAANEASYVLSTWSLKGFLNEVGSEIVALIKQDDSNVIDNKEVSTGMINILDSRSALEQAGKVVADRLGILGYPLKSWFELYPTEDYIEVDRKNEKMIVYTDTVNLPFIGFITDLLGISKDGKIKFGSAFSYDMSNWTARYGKPVELLLSIHLSTMMPDLSYRVARDAELNTKVNIAFQDVNIKYDTIATIGNQKTLTNDEIIDAFLTYGLSGENKSYEITNTETSETDDEEETESNENEDEDEEVVVESGEVNFYTEILNSLDSMEKKRQFFKNIMDQIEDHSIATDIIGVNIRNALLDEGSWIGNFVKTVLNDVFALVEKIFTKDNSYLVYIQHGEAEVPGLGISYDNLLELAEITSRGMENGIDNVKWPYIDSVTHHWFYEDIDFSKGVYRRASSAHKKIFYESADKENSSLAKNNVKVELDAKLTADEGIIYQVCEPETVGPNEAIKNIFNDEYYKFDGTTETADKIEAAKKFQSLRDFYYTQPGTYVQESENGNELYVYDLQTGMLINTIFNDASDVKKEKVSFEEDKSNALAAFSILENMHSEEAEYIYRDLKDLVVSLNYFTEDELTKDLENLLLWIINTNNLNERFEVTKDINEYGMLIKNVTGREIVAPENCNISEEDGVVTLEFTQMSDETAELFEYIYKNDYMNINKDILVGMTMKIKGIQLSKSGSAQRGEVIGTATDDVNIVMFDIDKSLIEDLEKYMTQKHNKAYEVAMKEKKIKESEQRMGIDIYADGIGSTGGSRVGGIGVGGSCSFISDGKWSYNESDFDILCAITRAESGENSREYINVITTACNRADRGLYGINDPLRQYTRNMQFTVYGTYENGNYGRGSYMQYLNHNYSSEVESAVRQALNGYRSHRYLSYRSANSDPTGRVQLVPGGNRYFNEMS